MKTDKFDEEFRRKVENFHPPFNDNEINRIQGYVGQHIPLSFWQRFGPVFTYSVGAFIIVSLLTTTVYKTYENKSLLKTISNLNTQLKQAKADTLATVIAPKEILVEKTDTVFITKYISVPSDNSVESLVVENNNINEKSVSINKETKGKEINSETSDNKSVTEKLSTKTTNNDVFESKNTNSPIIKSESKNFDEVSKKNGKILANTNSKSLNTTTADQQKSEVITAISANSVSPEMPISTSKSVAKEVENQVFNYDYLSHRRYNSDDNKDIFDLSKRNFTVPKLAIKASEKKTLKLPNINLPTLKYRVGFGIEKAHEHGGFNVLTDILVSKRWSITTGIGLSTFFDDADFDDEDDFKKYTKKDFRKEYESRIDDNGQINDIHIKQALIKIPFYINYRQPLPKNFTVLFSVGSNFDIYSRQFVSYNNQGLYRDDDHNIFSIKANTTPFNNLLFSTGIEKRWKKYSVQLSPYFMTQIKPIAYQKEDWQLGLKLNGFYRISR